MFLGEAQAYVGVAHMCFFRNGWGAVLVLCGVIVMCVFAEGRFDG
jgi:hypothetical protein